MEDMHVRSDSVDVEQIMQQIRARIREKRGVDYTEAELQQLASVKLERFLDPRGVRSDLVEQYRARRAVSPSPPNYEFEHDTLFETHRGALRALRRLLRPVLKLFFNPDRVATALNIQAKVNTQAEERLRRLEERDPLHFELIHNLTLEVTRLGIEVHNLKMHVESLSSRLDFDERRARSLETAQPRAHVARRPPPAGGDARSATGERQEVRGDDEGTAQGAERKRRRRRRRRRPGRTMADNAREAGGQDTAQEAGGHDAAPADADADARTTASADVEPTHAREASTDGSDAHDEADDQEPDSP